MTARARIDEELRRHRSELTVLFTDVVGSTSYFERFGDTAGFAMLFRCSDLASRTFIEHEGTIIKTIGDSVMAEFPEPFLAVQASVQLQRRLLESNRNRPERDHLQLRIGINTGSGIRYNQDVYGDVINVAARITKRTGPAQILISRRVKQALDAHRELQCVWAEKAVLSGKSEPEDVYEVVWTETKAYAELRQHLTDAVLKHELLFPGTTLGYIASSAGTSGNGSAADAASRENRPTSGHATWSGIPPRYQLLQELGSGGMGRVYKAFDRDTGEVVALKVLRPDIASKPSVIERFRNELRVARKITHKNVCRIYDLHRTDSTAAISMEFIEGRSLRQVLGESGPMVDEQMVSIGRQICAGLQEVHRQGVVHRDLKPENVMVDGSGTVKLMDFGIARAAASDITVTGHLVGTPAYMAPEQAEGKPVDARTDIYAFGLVLYEMCTGRCAFHGNTPVEVALKQIRQSPLAPREIQPNVSPQIELLIVKCLQKDASRRFASVDELDAALTRSNSVATREAEPVGPGRHAPQPSRLESPKPCALVLDDDLPTLRLMTEILIGSGWDVVGVDDAEEALALAARRIFDVISLDLRMPDMDGFEVARRIRRTEANANVPIVIVTGEKDKNTMEQAFSSGATMLLHKPVNTSRLEGIFKAVRSSRVTKRTQPAGTTKT